MQNPQKNYEIMFLTLKARESQTFIRQNPNKKDIVKKHLEYETEQARKLKRILNDYIPQN